MFSHFFLCFLGVGCFLYNFNIAAFLGTESFFLHFVSILLLSGTRQKCVCQNSFVNESKNLELKIICRGDFVQCFPYINCFCKSIRFRFKNANHTEEGEEVRKFKKSKKGGVFFYPSHFKNYLCGLKKILKGVSAFRKLFNFIQIFPLKKHEFLKNRGRELSLPFPPKKTFILKKI